MANLFARKPLDRLMKEADEVGEHSLKRSLGWVNLAALGIGGIIGNAPTPLHQMVWTLPAREPRGMDR